MRILLTLPLLFAFAPQPQRQADDPLEVLAERLQATDDLQERVALAQEGRRIDRGGSSWWFEVEARARLVAGDHAAVVRLCTEALVNPLEAVDQAVILELRARAYTELGQPGLALGDRMRSLQWNPEQPILTSEVHAEWSARIRNRFIQRTVRDAEQFLDFMPDEASAHLAMARAQCLDGDFSNACNSFHTANVKSADALRLSDWLTYFDAAEREEDFHLQAEALHGAHRLAPDAGYAATALEMEELAAEMQSGNMGYGGGYDGYGEDESESEPGPTEPPSVLTDEELREDVLAWGARIDHVEAVMWDHLEGLRPLDTRAEDLDDVASDVTTVESLASLEPEVRALQAELAVWFQAHTELVIEMRALEDELLPWSEWAVVHVNMEESLRDAIFHHSNRVHSFPSLEVWDPREPLAATIARHEGRLVNAAAWQVAHDTLIAQRGTLAAHDVQARAGALLSSGQPTADLLATFAIAAIASGNEHEGVPALHLALASEPSAPFAEELHTTLLGLSARADELMRASEVALSEDRPHVALGFAERATDLQPHGAGFHHQEAICWERIEPSMLGLDAARMATSIEPANVTYLRSHLRHAAGRRHLSECVEVMNLMVNLDPRNPEYLEERIQYLMLCDDIERARSDSMFAYELRGGSYSGRPSSRWPDCLATNGCLGVDLNDSWSNSKPLDVINSMPAWPAGDRFSKTTKDVAAGLLAALNGEATLDSIREPVVGLTDLEQAEWQAVSKFLAGEVATCLDHETDAKIYYEAALRDRNLPLGIARCAAKRLGRSLRIGPPQQHEVIRVPADVATLDEAVRIGRNGQTIFLAKGSHRLDRPLERSIRIVGEGADETLVTLFPEPKNYRADGQIHLMPGPRNGSPGGWLEFVDLSLGQYGRYKRLTHADGPDDSLVVLRGGVTLERCELRDGTRLLVNPGTTLTVRDSDLTSAKSDPIHVDGGALHLDRVVLAGAVTLANGASLRADHVTLTDLAALRFDGAETTGQIGSLAAYGLAQSGVQATQESLVHIEELIWDATGAASFVDASADSAVLLESGLAWGEGVIDPAPDATVASFPFARTAREEPEVVVSTSAELQAALNTSAPHVHLEPGVYALKNHHLYHDLVLVGLGDGVQLQVPRDEASTMLRVRADVSLVMHNIELGVMIEDLSDPNHPIRKLGGGILRDEVHEQYRLLDVEGSVVLHGCRQAHQGAGDHTAKEILAYVRNSGSFAAFGMNYARGVVAESQGRAWMVDSPVDILTVSNEAQVHLLGRGDLERLEVTGRNAIVTLGELGPKRLKLAAFREGAPDPRSDLRKRSDGSDPQVLQAKLIAEAKASILEPLTVDSTAREWGVGLMRYAKAYDNAMTYTISNRDECERLAAQQVLAPLRGRVDRVRAFLDPYNVVHHSHGISDHVRAAMPKDDYIRYISENRATHHLGDDATSQEIQTYASWEEAVLGGHMTKEQMEEGRKLGLSIAGYKAEERRLALEEAARQAAYEAALVAGDSDDIKRALKAISINTWLEYVANDENASWNDLMDAVSCSYRTGWHRELSRRLDTMRAAQPVASNNTWTGSNWSSGSASSGASSGYSNEFQAWQTSFQNSMDNLQRSIDATASSSYKSYRNRYDY